MKKNEAISILATSSRPREPKDRARYDEAVKMAIEALKQPDTNCSEFPNSSDTISRQAAIEALGEKPLAWTEGEYELGLQNQWQSDVDALNGLPSAQPERKTGHWIKTARWGRVYYCDQCRNYLDFDGVNVGRGSTNFCPNCGADMRGERSE